MQLQGLQLICFDAECTAVRAGPVDGPAIFENCKGCQVGMPPTLLTALCTWQYSKLVSTASHLAAHSALARVVPAHRCLPAWVFVWTWITSTKAVDHV